MEKEDIIVIFADCDATMPVAVLILSMVKPESLHIASAGTVNPTDALSPLAQESAIPSPAPALYLIPVGMSDAPLGDVLPEGNLNIVRGIRIFIVENVRNARRFLKRCDPAIDISALTFHELNRHTDTSQVNTFLDPLRHGVPVGLMSDAGCPAVADPGAIAVAVAQREGFRVKPLVGPSSILMALMASGFNGQGFAFHGYLPIDEGERAAALRCLEAESRRHDMTQIFIETPYRNDRMLRFLADTLSPQTMLCVACDITAPQSESIRSMPAARWRALLDRKAPDFDKRPAIFLIYAGSGESVHQSKEKHLHSPRKGDGRRRK